jgi:energy-coupling factor transport system permease protein
MMPAPRLHSAKLDPRTRLTLGFTCLAAVIAAARMETAAVQSAIILVLLLGMGLGRSWLRSMRLLFPTILLVFVVVYLSFTINEALFSAAKLFNLLTISFIFFNRMSPEEMGDALRKMHVPYSFAFILTTSMRFVPLLRQKTRNIMDAQLSRGIDLSFRPKNITHIMALLVPLTIQSFMLSEQLAMTLEMRGFTGAKPTLRRPFHLQRLDYTVMTVAVSGLAAFLWLERVRLW